MQISPEYKGCRRDLPNQNSEMSKVQLVTKSSDKESTVWYEVIEIKMIIIPKVKEKENRYSTCKKKG